jgi:predicted dinucleotide-binding enzyme
MKGQPMKIGIIGAGYVARAIAALAIKHGYQVMLSNSRGPRTLYTTCAMLKCDAGTVSEAIAFGEIVVVAIPFYAYDELPFAALDDKLVVDAGNYHPRRDGQIKVLDDRETTSTQMLADRIPDAKIVKAFNAVLAPDLDELTHTGPSDPRRALPIAGNDGAAKSKITELHEEFGLDVVDVGPLSESWRFETNKPAYCARLTKSQLIERLAMAKRDSDWPQGHWTS